MNERLYVTKVWYDDSDNEFDLFITLDNCYKVINDITCFFWLFGENGETRETIMKRLKESNCDKKLIDYLEVLEDDKFDYIYDSGVYELIHDVLEDCGQLVPTSYTSSASY